MNVEQGLRLEGVSSAPGSLADETEKGGDSYKYLAKGDQDRVREKIRRRKEFEHKGRAGDTLVGIGKTLKEFSAEHAQGANGDLSCNKVKEFWVKTEEITTELNDNVTLAIKKQITLSQMEHLMKEIMTEEMLIKDIMKSG